MSNKMKTVNEIIQQDGLSHLFKLCEERNIKIREDVNSHGNELWTLNYNQIDSPKTDWLVKQCRGVVVNEKGVVAHVLPRFFNVDEIEGDKFDWSSFDAYEKVDGSLIKLYHDGDEWQIGTRGTATAMVEGHGGDYIFREEVLKTFGYSDEEEFQNEAEKSFIDSWTYLLEFIGPQNRVVTPYEESEMVLLAVIDDGLELSRDEMEEEFWDIRKQGLNVRMPNVEFSLDRDSLFRKVRELENLQEGFVIKDSKGNRLKIKSDLYVKAHLVRGEGYLSEKRAIELVLDNEQSEYLAYFPEDAEKVNVVEERLRLIKDNAELAFAVVKRAAGDDRKLFAQYALKHENNFLLFGMMDGKTADEVWQGATRKRKIQIFME